MIIHYPLNLPDFQPLVEHRNTHGIAYDNLPLNKNMPATLNSKEGIERGFAHYIRDLADPVYTDYVKSLIPEIKDNIMEIGFPFISNATNHPAGSILAPHVDKIRGEFCVIWVIEPGGENVETIWWQQEGFPVVREGGLKTINYPALNPINRVAWKKNSWGVFRTNILHSVEPITTTRIGFTIGFDGEDNFNRIIEKYGIHTS